MHQGDAVSIDPGSELALEGWEKSGTALVQTGGGSPLLEVRRDMHTGFSKPEACRLQDLGDI